MPDLEQLKDILRTSIKEFIANNPNTIGCGGYEIELRNYIHDNFENTKGREILNRENRQRTDLRLGKNYLELKHNFIRQTQEGIDRVDSDIRKIRENHNRNAYVLVTITVPKESTHTTLYKTPYKRRHAESENLRKLNDKFASNQSLLGEFQYYNTNNCGRVIAYLICAL